jgi:putative transposase
MDKFESPNHTKWECRYHAVFIPKCRRKTLYVRLRQYLGEVFRKLAEQKESRIEEGHLVSDHVAMMISIRRMPRKDHSHARFHDKAAEEL